MAERGYDVGRYVRGAAYAVAVTAVAVTPGGIPAALIVFGIRKYMRRKDDYFPEDLRGNESGLKDITED